MQAWGKVYNISPHTIFLYTRPNPNWDVTGISEASILHIQQSETGKRYMHLGWGIANSSNEKAKNEMSCCSHCSPGVSICWVFQGPSWSPQVSSRSCPEPHIPCSSLLSMLGYETVCPPLGCLGRQYRLFYYIVTCSSFHEVFFNINCSLSRERIHWTSLISNSKGCYSKIHLKLKNNNKKNNSLSKILISKKSSEKFLP